MAHVKRNQFILATVSLLALSSIFVIQKTSATSSNAVDSTSVAWYAANIKAAQEKNKQCRASDATELKESPECLNALHALEISFGVKN